MQEKDLFIRISNLFLQNVAQEPFHLKLSVEICLMMPSEPYMYQNMYLVFKNMFNDPQSLNVLR